MGVTTNPSIFAAAFTGSDAYDAQIRDLAARGAGVTEALRVLTTVADDAVATIAQARRRRGDRECPDRLRPF